jgi:hypothetical protein
VTRQNGRRVAAASFGAIALAAFLAYGLPRFGGRSNLASGSEGGHVRKPIPSKEAIAMLPEDGGPEYNRLIFEKSPYLLQHAGNPVDWYPWGEEAFEAAKEQDKPIFLSIGYSTCHWCHVMEAESFEDDEVAELMNQHFINIKVDREERPDVDGIYMNVCHRLSGGNCGWPLNVLMTAERKPFFSGTYFPKHGRLNRPGMMDLVPQVGEAWNTRRDQIVASAEEVTNALRIDSFEPAGEELGPDVLDKAYAQSLGQYDSARGGFGKAPKFPVSHRCLFLLRYWKRTGEEQALRMVEGTLAAMRRGGIYDHVGLGFHRYSTDADWLVPHFEKMLYDQALLAMAYAEAYQATGESLFAETTREIVTYILRDMTSPEGGFYSAEDADSEGAEGKFYLWSLEEIEEVLTESEAKLAASVFNITPGGNFRDPHQGGPMKTILHRTQSLNESAEELGFTEDALKTHLETIRVQLFDHREKRIHPYKDDKILTDWNGLMIAAMSKAARALDEPAFAAAASKAADFVLESLRDDRGRLLKRYREGSASLPAHLDDYAFLVWGLLELYETTFEVRFLQEAVALNESMLELFWDSKNGGLFFTAHDGEELLVRRKEVYDGAIPSGNSAAMYNLMRLSRITGDEELERKAARIGGAFSRQISRGPYSNALLMCALDFALSPSFEVVIAGRQDGEDTRAMLKALRGRYTPNKVVVFRPMGDESPAVAEIAPYTANQRSLGGQATAYVCRNFTCKAPTTDPAKMLASLSSERETSLLPGK